jgi:hypothetical protein
MTDPEVAGVVEQVRRLVETRYVFPEVAAAVSRRLAEGLAERRYPVELRGLATAVTADLQHGNGDQHLRLVYHQEPLADRAPGDDTEEYAAMARWAAGTSGGVATVARREPNLGFLALDPVLFPTAVAGEHVTAAMTLLADTSALVVDLRRCLGGEPTMVAFLVSYLWDHEPVELTGLRGRDGHTRQSWTLPYVPGRRFGKSRPVYVLTSATTFSGGEALAFDLQQLGRATVVGETTRGGANPREGFRVHPHVELTVSVAAAVHPVTGANWEGTGVVPNVATSAADAEATAHRLAVDRLAAGDGSSQVEQRPGEREAEAATDV